MAQKRRKPTTSRKGRPRLGVHDKAATDAEVSAMVGWLAKRAVAERRRRVHGGPRARDLLVVQLLASTGLRASELARLELRDVHLAKRSSYLRVRGGKARDRRDVDTVPIPWDLVAELERWMSQRIGLDRSGAPIAGVHGEVARVDPRYELTDPMPLFTAATSSRPLDRREVWRIVKSAVRACELREVLNAHSLRHYFATRVAKASRSSATVQKLMRLRSSRLADQYVHLALSDVAGVVGQLKTPGVRRRRSAPPRAKRRAAR